MAGVTHRIVNKRTYTFTELQAGQTQTLVLHRGIDASAYREATLLVAVHSSAATTNNTIEVLAVPVVLTDDEPQTDFVENAAAATATIDADLTGQLLAQPLSDNFGSMIQIHISGRQDSTTVTLEAEITVDLSLKE